MSEENLSISAGVAFMERCLDSEISAQRSKAHSAIDNDDWESLAKTKEAISHIEMLRVKFAEFKKATGDVSSEPMTIPAPEPEKQKEPEVKAPVAEPESAKPVEEPAKPEPTEQKPFSFAEAVEELVDKYPFAMAVCNAVPNMNNIFTYDETFAKSDMKKPVQLSNGMWAETAVPEDKARLITDALHKYCESRK